MNLKLILPSKILIDTEVEKITIEGEEGSRGILQNHIDAAVSVVPSIMSYHEDGTEKFAAHDEGILVKQGSKLLFSTKQAVINNKLGRLKEILESEIKSLSKIEKNSKSAVAMLESNIIKKFREQQRNLNG